MEQIKFAAAYLRVSTNEQAEFSPDAQLTAIREFAEHNGFIVLPEHVFIDEGISGRRAEKRPSFMRMVSTAKQKPVPFEVIFVHKIDRFARSREDSVVYKSLLRREFGVKVISITENIEDDKFSVILEAMLEAMAEYYSLNLSEEVKKGMTEKARRGGLQSVPSFGYSVYENTLTPHPEESLFVKQIFSRFIAGEGYYAIARWLNESGVRTHRGNRFENRTIEYIIRNPVYIGKLRWNPEGKTKRGDYDNPSIMIADGKHEAIIDICTWEAAQRRVTEMKAIWRKHMRPGTEHRDWLSGLMKCSACGSTLIRSNGRYWKCNAYVKGACKYSQHVSDKIIKAMLINALAEESRQTYKLDYVGVQTAPSKWYIMDELHAKLKKIELKLKKIKDAYINGVDSLDDYKNAKALIESEHIKVELEISAIEEEHMNDKNMDIRNQLMDVVSLLTSDVSLQDKHKIARGIIKEIIFDKEMRSLSILLNDNIVP